MALDAASSASANTLGLMPQRGTLDQSSAVSPAVAIADEFALDARVAAGSAHIAAARLRRRQITRRRRELVSIIFCWGRATESPRDMESYRRRALISR